MSTGRAIKNEINANLYNYRFASAYYEMQKSLGYPLKVSCGLFHERYIENFCGALYGNHPWLIPNGNIVTCQDAGDKAVVIGTAMNGVLKIFETEDIYAEQTAINRAECVGCSLYEYCKGGCPLSRNTNEAEDFRRWCCREAKDYRSLKLMHLLKGHSFGTTYLQKYNFENYPTCEAYIIKS